MKAVVDKDLCIGCRSCIKECPEVFRMDMEGKSEAILGELPYKLTSKVRSAWSQCPSDAIDLE